MGNCCGFRRDGQALFKWNGSDRCSCSYKRLCCYGNLHRKYVRYVRVTLQTRYESGGTLRDSRASSSEQCRQRCVFWLGWSCAYYYKRCRHYKRIKGKNGLGAVMSNWIFLSSKFNSIIKNSDYVT